MTSMTIRNVPPEVRDVLAGRAARQGMSLQEYLRAQLEQLAAKPALDELLDEIAARKRATGTMLDPAAILDYIAADRR